MPRFEPPDGLEAPRVTGVRTFARCPHVRDPAGADVAIVGAPFDGGSTYRPGSRFGPEAIRSVSVLLRPYHPALDVDVFGGRSTFDYGDLATTPGNAERTMGQIADGLAEILASGARPLVLGGDHTIVLGELRAHRLAAGRPLGVVLLDSHADTWDSYYGTERYMNGTPLRRALEEDLIDPSRSLLAGMRGSLYAAADATQPAELGFEVIDIEELMTLSPGGYADRVRARIGDGPAFLSFDIDFVDPAFAPGTGTPEPGGPTSREALAHLRSLAGIRFAGYDVVEVSPGYDDTGQSTALLAATVAHDMLALDTLAYGSNGATGATAI